MKKTTITAKQSKANKEDKYFEVKINGEWDYDYYLSLENCRILFAFAYGEYFPGFSMKSLWEKLRKEGEHTLKELEKNV